MLVRILLCFVVIIASFCVGLAESNEASGSSSLVGKIKHVVVLMLENRSFDHVFGWLKSLNPKIDGVNGDEKQPLNCSDPNSEMISVNDKATWVTEDPDHGFDANNKQLFGYGQIKYPPTMNGFVEQYYERYNNISIVDAVVSSFNPSNIPTLSALANEFALFQKWHCSVPSSTWPNRLYLHSATSDGESSTSDFARLLLGFPQKTIYDLLDENNLSWKVFFSEIPDTLLFQSGRKLESLAKHIPYFEFASTVSKGELPNFSFIAPKYFDIPCIPADDMHPPHDFSLGELRVKELYETLRAGPQWNETLLIVTFDENGGFSDHVPPPMKDVPSPDSKVSPEGFNFDRLGVRVPTLMISPWIEAGTIIGSPSSEDKPTPSSEWDHTSIISTVIRLFNMTGGPLTARDSWSAHFDSLFKARTEPRTDCPMTLPVPPVNPNFQSRGNNVMTSLQYDILNIIAGAAGVAEGFPSALRTEIEGAKWAIQTVYEKILKREIPQPLKHALTINTGYESVPGGVCEQVQDLVRQEIQKSFPQTQIQPEIVTA